MRYIILFFLINYSIMDEKTNIEHFNHYLKLFVQNIMTTFSEYEEVLGEYYKPLLDNDRCNDDKYVKRFMRKMKDYKNEIANKDNSIFNDTLCVLKNVDFKILWESEELSESNKTKIWEYLQTLFVLGDTIVSTSNKVKELLENLNEGTSNPVQDEAIKKMMENLNNVEEGSQGPFNEEFLKNSSIGQLASELSEEFNPQEFLGNLDENANPADLMKNFMSGENSMNFMNLFEKIGSKIKNKVESGEFNHENLLQDAQNMMGNLQNSGLGDLMGNLAEVAPVALNPTQERLRRKLEQRKK